MGRVVQEELKNDLCVFVFSRWKYYIPLKHEKPLTHQHTVASWKTWILNNYVIFDGFNILNTY
jgi:hypothetical protein